MDGFESLPVVQCRAKFELLERALFKLPQIEKEDYLLEEYYSGGMYCRKITIPKDAMITGRIYKFDHIEIMLKGSKITVSADGPKKHYKGFNVIEAKSGKRQVGLALEETIWMTICQVPENIPLHEMLDYTTVSSYEEYYNFYNKLNLIDYNKFLIELGTSQDEMDKAVKSGGVATMSDKYDHIYVSNSELQGQGLFTKIAIKQGDIICPARVSTERTIAGRYSNHALYANSYPYSENGVFYFVARKDIMENEEITSNYREIFNFRHSEGDL